MARQAEMALDVDRAHTVIENVRDEREYIVPPDYVNDDDIGLSENSRNVL